MNRVLFSSASDRWATPREVYASLDAEFHFDYDPCPIDGDSDGLATLLTPWMGKRVFCNPPYGPALAKWLERALEADLAVFLVPARTDTRWFHEIVLPKAKEIRFVRGRLRFGNAVNPAPFPSMIVIFENRTRRELSRLQTLLAGGHPDQDGIRRGIDDLMWDDVLAERGKRG